jgi:hypothetical protein
LGRCWTLLPCRIFETQAEDLACPSKDDDVNFILICDRLTEYGEFRCNCRGEAVALLRTTESQPRDSTLFIV